MAKIFFAVPLIFVAFTVIGVFGAYKVNKCYMCNGTIDEVKNNCKRHTCDEKMERGCAAVYTRAEGGTFANLFCWGYTQMKDVKDVCRRDEDHIDAHCYCFSDNCNNPAGSPSCQCLAQFNPPKD